MKTNKELLQSCLYAFDRISDRLRYEEGKKFSEEDREESYLDAIDNLCELEEAIQEIEREESKIDFTRVNRDVNGNPRYVCHFLVFIGKKEGYSFGVESNYNLALKRAKAIGGRKFHNKQYGGGIVFQSYNTNELQKQIKELMKQYQ